MIKQILILLMVTLLVGCSSRPKDVTVSHKSKNSAFSHDNACSLLRASNSWRVAYENTYEKHGVPPHVVMAFIRQESSFNAEAKPTAKSVFGGVSSAYGYPQAKDETWAWYQDKNSKHNARRNEMPDAVDFIGWYIKVNHKRSGVSKWETEEQYYAYHDGMGGYEKGTHLAKPWLLKVGKKVHRYASEYRSQLSKCFKY